MPQYEDFFLIIQGAEGNYTVEGRGPGEVSVPPLPLGFAFTNELKEEVELIAQGFTPTRERMQEVGAALYDALFPRALARAFGRAYEALPEGAHMRIKLAVRPPELNRLPWELLFNPDDEYFLTARITNPLVRYVESDTPVASLLAANTLKVLYVQAQPQGMAALNLEASEQALRAGLGEQVEVTVVRNCTPEKLREQLREAYHILHYDGHASFDVEKGEGSLCLEDEQGGTHHVSGELLATYLDGTSVRLVVLAACESGMDSPRKRFSGIAQQIMKSSSLPAVVAMQFAVVDGSAIAFNKGFYSGLAGRMPVEAALVEGRKAILETVGGDPFAAPDWATPVLFMRTRDGNLFVGDEEEAMAEKDKKQDKPSISFGKGATISGDFVVGNKTSVKTGNISASGGGMVNVAGGNIQQTIEQTTGQEQPLTRQDFERLMVEIHKVIEKAGLDSDTQEEAAGMLQKAQSQAAAPQPNKALIETRLKGIVELVTAAGGAASALQQLAPLVQKAIETVGKLF
jgi:hypothetical protein